MIRFITAQIENFRPYRNRQMFRFSEDSDVNVQIVFGRNGSGKTSLINTVRFILYGYALNKNRDKIALTKLVNRDGASAGDHVVTGVLVYEVDGVRHELTRILKPRKLTFEPDKDQDFKHELHLKRGSDVIPGGDVTRIVRQTFPEETSRFFLFDGEILDEYEDLLEEGSQQAKQIQTEIESVLGVPALINGRDQTEVLVGAAQKEQRKANKAVLSQRAHVDAAEKLQSQLDALQNDKSKVELLISEHKERIEELEQDLNGTQEAERAQGELDGLSNQLKMLNEKGQQEREQMATLLGSAWIDLLKPQIAEREEQLGTEFKRLTQMTERRWTLTEQERRLRKSLESQECSSCKQQLPVSAADEIRTQLVELESSLQEIGDVDLERKAKMEADLSTLRRLKAKSESQLSTISFLEDSMDNALLQRHKIERRQAELYEAVQEHDSAVIARKRKTYDNLRLEVRANQRKINTIDADIQDKLQTLKEHNRHISDSPQTDTYTALLVDTCEQLHAIFDVGIGELRDELRMKVNQMATETFSRLINEDGYSGLQVNEHYGLTMLDDQGRPAEEPSAGQSQIIAFSLIDSLSRIARKGPIIVDTPLARLDPHHRSSVLQHIPSMGTQVVLLVHEGELPRNHPDLQVLKPRLSGVFDIKRINVNNSKIERGEL